MCVSHLADTFVVKETQSVTKDSGVVPVMSSHWAGDVPPVWDRGNTRSLLTFQSSHNLLVLQEQGGRRYIYGADMLESSTAYSPVMLQSRRRHGAQSPRWPLGWPSADLGGTGIVMVMGLWNFLLRGSTVTIGLKVALFPRTALTMSSGTGWA